MTVEFLLKVNCSENIYIVNYLFKNLKTGFWYPIVAQKYQKHPQLSGMAGHCAIVHWIIYISVVFIYISVVSSICSIFELHISKFCHVRIKIQIKILNQNPYSTQLPPNSNCAVQKLHLRPRNFKYLLFEDIVINNWFKNMCKFYY